MDVHNQNTSWLRVWIVFLCGVNIAFLVGKISPALPVIADELAFNLLESGLLVSALVLINVLFAILVGIYANKNGVLKVSIAAMVCAGLSSIVGGLSASYELLLLSRVGEGFGLAAGMICLPTLIFQSINPKDRLAALSLWSAFMPGGMAISMAFAPIVIENFSWQFFWILIGGLNILMAFILFVSFRKVQLKKQPIKFSFKICNTRVIKRIVIFMMFGMQFMSVASLLVTYLKDIGVSLNIASYINAFVVLLNIVGNIAAGKLLNLKVKEPTLYIIGFSTMLITLPIFFIANDLFIKVLSICIFSMVIGVVPATIWATMPSLGDSKYISFRNAFLVQGIGIGQFIGPILITFFIQQFGSWHYSLIVTALCFMVSIVLSISIKNQEVKA